MILPFNNHYPDCDQALFIAENATIVGQVTLEEECTVWYSATLRGDLAPIYIGRATNVQDNAVIHVNYDMLTRIEQEVTIGHSAIIHACTIGRGALIGMGAIILDGAEIGEYSLVAAGSLVPPGKSYPPHSMIMGTPAKVVRSLSTGEIEEMAENNRHYILLGRAFAAK
ncbi:MAG: gamma carbonic anhydrase family protein [Sphaerochaetaceae bacterium]